MRRSRENGECAGPGRLGKTNLTCNATSPNHTPGDRSYRQACHGPSGGSWAGGRAEEKDAVEGGMGLWLIGHESHASFPTEGVDHPLKCIARYSQGSLSDRNLSTLTVIPCVHQLVTLEVTQLQDA